MSTFWNRWFGGGDEQAAPEQSRRRRSTVTDAGAVASAFGSGDPAQVERIMRRHEVRVTDSASAKNQAQLFKVQQQSKVLTRDDTDGPHEMRTFHISAGATKGDANTFHGTYFPMTTREQGWSGGGTGSTFQPDSVIHTQQRSDIALSTPLTACFVTDGADGLGHMQPYRAPSIDPKTTTAQEEAVHYQQHNTHAGHVLGRQYDDVFGPQEYGKFKTVGGRRYRTSTAVVMADETGQKHIMAQSIYGSHFGSEPQAVEFTSRPFGVAPRPNQLTIDRVPDTMTPAPIPTNHDLLTPPAPRNLPTHRDMLPVITRRRSVDDVSAAPKVSSSVKKQQRKRSSSVT